MEYGGYNIREKIAPNEATVLGRKYGTLEDLTKEEKENLRSSFNRFSEDDFRRFFYAFTDELAEYYECNQDVKYPTRFILNRCLAIAECIPKELEAVNLTSHNRILEFLLFCIVELANLKTLRLYDTHIEDLEHIKACYTGPKLLNELCICNCTLNSKIDSKRQIEFFQTLLHYQRTLKKLDLRGTNFSPEVIELLKLAQGDENELLHNVEVLIEPGDTYKKDGEEQEMNEID